MQREEISFGHPGSWYSNFHLLFFLVQRLILHGNNSMIKLSNIFCMIDCVSCRSQHVVAVNRSVWCSLMSEHSALDTVMDTVYTVPYINVITERCGVCNVVVVVHRLQ
jgi:hypothetical protein